MIFVDTSVWFAFFLPIDPDHERVRAWVAATSGPLVTTDYCVDETLTLLSARRELRRALEAGHEFFRGKVARIQFVAEEQIYRAWILFQQRAAAGWSFTDCTSKVVIDDLGIRTAAALDDHFRQFGNVTVVP
ncbi:MAG TPA: PIN domain-containing protein [Pirellulaceae bacterium]|nr:PIN domain-containing protein [Pirellulaceae bacterium]